MTGNNIDCSLFRIVGSFSRMHHSSLWRPRVALGSLPSESRVTCLNGARGGCERQYVGQSMNY